MTPARWDWLFTVGPFIVVAAIATHAIWSARRRARKAVP